MTARRLLACLAATTLALAAGGGKAGAFFSPRSFWNQPVPAGAALDPLSEAATARLARRVAREQSAARGPWINTSSYSVPLYTVPASQPDATVALVGTRNPSLSAAWASVPLPASARPAAGSDRLLVVSQPSRDSEWEFWHLQRTPEGWQAGWGGAIEHVSISEGVFGGEAWPGAQSWWGASASSLSVLGGLVTLSDLASGRIEHALSIAVPGIRGGVFASPAQRTDGTAPFPLALPEGAHLRLDPHLDLAALGLPPLTLMLARAAQRYGIFVTDSSPVVEFYAQDPTPTGSNPYLGPAGYFGGERPSQLLASFPWRSLQLLDMELHPAH